MLHLDVVRNDWQAGKRVLVGQILAEDEEIIFHELDAVDLRPQVEALAADTAQILDPKTRLATIADALGGPVIAFVGPHNEAECPFGTATTHEIEWGDLNDAGELLSAQSQRTPDPILSPGDLITGQHLPGPAPSVLVGVKKRLHHAR